MKCTDNGCESCKGSQEEGLVGTPFKGGINSSFEEWKKYLKGFKSKEFCVPVGISQALN